MAASTNTAKIFPDSSVTYVKPIPPATWAGDTEFQSPVTAIVHIKRWEIK